MARCCWRGCSADEAMQASCPMNIGGGDVSMEEIPLSADKPPRHGRAGEALYAKLFDWLVGRINVRSPPTRAARRRRRFAFSTSLGSRSSSTTAEQLRPIRSRDPPSTPPLHVQDGGAAVQGQRTSAAPTSTSSHERSCTRSRGGLRQGLFVDNSPVLAPRAEGGGAADPRRGGDARR